MLLGIIFGKEKEALMVEMDGGYSPLFSGVKNKLIVSVVVKQKWLQWSVLCQWSVFIVSSVSCLSFSCIIFRSFECQML